MRRIFDQGPPGLEIRIRNPISYFDTIKSRIPGDPQIGAFKI